MARPVRVDVEGGIYHVICRGTERCDLFRCYTDYLHLLNRLAEAQRRFRLLVYGYVLMKNHFHLIICTPEANLSRAMQWLKASYSMWFNAKYHRVGPLFQGRFKGVLVENDGEWLLELSLYVHLNPVRVKRLGFDKHGKILEGLGWSVPEQPAVRERLYALRSFPWSSYPYYAGYRLKVPEWLSLEPLNQMVESQAAYRRMIEYRITHGIDEDVLIRLQDRLALGSEKFVSRIRRMCSVDPEFEGIRALKHRTNWEEVVNAVEKQKLCNWTEFSTVRGDWGRAAVFYLARKYAGMTLREIGEAAGGINYPAVSQLVKRFERRLHTDRPLSDEIGQIERMLNVQT
jgi:REP element-mobilizing transposase RayT